MERGERKRARELGIAPGGFPAGPLNSITDVPGVRVGHVTLADGAGIRTGVTAVVPDAVDRAGGSLPAGLFVGNGFGKMIGATQVAELGAIETPVLLTGTLSAFRVADALVTYLLRLPGNERLTTVNPVVGETNDGFLSDIRARPVTQGHVLSAVAGARGGPVGEGAVGAGTGTAALGFKAGIGTSSRRVRLTGPGGRAGTIGVLVQSNFSGLLTVRGVPVPAAGNLSPADDAGPAGNSCMIVVATDHRLDARQLGRVAKRAVFAMGRTGADFAGTSGDYAIAFGAGASAVGAAAGREPDGGAAAVPDSALGPVFAAVQDAVEEAILNSLFMATTTVGHLGRVRQAVPLDAIVAACRARGVLGDGR